MRDQLMEDTKNQLEDGAEEGEITEDDEELPPLSALHKNSNQNPIRRDHLYRTSSNTTKSSSKISTGFGFSKGANKHKDYDRTLNDQDNAMFNSWTSTVTTVHRRRADSQVEERPTDDFKRSIIASAKNQDNLPKPEFIKAEAEVASSPQRDKDFRTDEENRAGAIDDVEDSDLRRGDSFVERRRRRSISSSGQEQNFKRARGVDDSVIQPPPQPPPINNEGICNEMQYRGIDANFGCAPFSGVGRGAFFRGRGGFRVGRGNFRPWTEHLICKFFREGYCRDGDSCTYSHNAADSQRRTELCRFYQQSFCKKGLYCTHLHGEFPCKAFHKGECTKDQCQFSHQPLDDYTRPLFEKMLREEEMIPSFPIAHPGTSNCRGNFQGNAFLPHQKLSTPQQGDPPQQIDPATGCVIIQPPALVVPTMLTTRPFNRGGGMAHIRGTGTYGFFNPVNSQSSNVFSTASASRPPMNQLPASQVVSTQQQQQQIPPVQLQDFKPQIQSTGTETVVEPSKLPLAAHAAPSELESESVAIKTETVSTPPSSPLPIFNISKMLEQITQHVTGLPSKNSADSKLLIDESPASPPMFSEPTYQSTAAKVIPVVCSWRLISVDLPEEVGINFDLKLSQTLSNSLNVNADPRLRKMAEKQFDQTTKSITQEQNAAQANRQARSQSQANTHTSYPPSTSAKPTTVNNPVDPRRKDRRNGSTKESSDFTQTTDTQDASFEPSERAHLLFGMLTPNNPDGDIDHRIFPLPPLNLPPPGYSAPYLQESLAAPINVEGQQITTEMPFKNSFGGFQNSDERNEYNSGFRERSNSGHARKKEFGGHRGRPRGDRSHRGGRTGDRGGDAGPFQGRENNTKNSGRYMGGKRRHDFLQQDSSGNTNSTRKDVKKDSVPQKQQENTGITSSKPASSVPQLSLREKRKNNEYESPLNRLTRQ